MTEKILDIIKNLSAIVDKHLVPAVLSFVIGIGVYLYVGESFWMVNQLTTTIFVIFIACIAFLVISLIVWCAAVVKSWRVAQSDKKYYQKQEEKQQEENDKKLLDFFDRQTKETIEIIKQLLETENAPIYVDSYKLDEGNFECAPGYSRRGTDGFQTNLLICKWQASPNGRFCYKVIMQEPFFRAAKHIMQKYGKITRYDF